MERPPAARRLVAECFPDARAAWLVAVATEVLDGAGGLWVGYRAEAPPTEARS